MPDVEFLKDGTFGKFRGTLLWLVGVGCLCCASGKADVEPGFIFLLERRGLCISD